MTEVQNKFLENLEYQISLKEENEDSFRKIPIFSNQVKVFDKSVTSLTEKFQKIRLRDKYQLIIAELDNLIKNSKSR